MLRSFSLLNLIRFFFQPPAPFSLLGCTIHRPGHGIRWHSLSDLKFRFTGQRTGRTAPPPHVFCLRTEQHGAGEWAFLIYSFFLFDKRSRRCVVLVVRSVSPENQQESSFTAQSRKVLTDGWRSRCKARMNGHPVKWFWIVAQWVKC